MVIRRVDNFGVAVVLRSEDPKYSAGDYVAGYISQSPALFGVVPKTESMS